MASTQGPSSLNFEDILHHLAQFLEIGIHYILYVRQVYPADLFDAYKKWSVPVWKSRHPKLSSYIAEVTKSSMEHISQGKVKRFVVAIKDSTTDQTLEHFVFGLTWLKPPEWFQNSDAQRRYESGLSLAELELKLRSFLLKLSTLDAQLLPLPKDLTFAVFLELYEAGHPLIGTNPETGEAAPWLPATMTEADPIETVDPNDRMHILRKATFGVIDLELEVEENAIKMELLQSSRALPDSDTEDPSPPTTTKVDKGKGRAFD